MNDAKVRAHLMISGRVQGVCYRLETRHAAHRFGVRGWVRNRSDGRVEALVEGEESRVEGLIEWCRTGPPAASVRDVTVSREEYLGDLGEFQITR